MVKLSEFITYLLSHVDKSIYIWGGQGQNLSDLTEHKIRNMETSSANANKAIAMWKTRKNIPGAKAFDCSGLGMYFLQNMKGIYGDMTANDMKGLCNKLSKSNLKKGDWVFKCYPTGKAYHIGYIVDDSLNVVEAQGRAYGVVKRPLSKGGWNAYGRPQCFEDDTKKETQQPAQKPTQTGGKCIVETVNVRKGSKGDAVKAMQQLLNLRIKAGLAVDGVCGAKSDAAIRSYQKAKGLTADGICGSKTWTKLING